MRVAFWTLLRPGTAALRPTRTPACLGLRGQAQRDPAFACAEIFRINSVFRPSESAVAAPLCRRSPKSSTPNCLWPVLAHGHHAAGHPLNLLLPAVGCRDP